MSVPPQPDPHADTVLEHTASSESELNLEAERVFATVARSVFGEEIPDPQLGRFSLRSKLGAGAMGVVYSAHDPDADREVAIKVLHDDRVADDEATSRLKREARALIRIDHPNVVKIHEVGSAAGKTFIAMELLRGESLAALLERKGRIPPAELIVLFRGVCGAVGEAHARGITHRDLKPANIFLHEAPNGMQAKVLDFGMAKGMLAGTLSASTQSGMFLGTPKYTSPEQLRDSSKIDHRTDLWAVGVIVFECLLGRPPFDGKTLSTLVGQIVGDDPPVPSEVGDVPPEFDAWFARALDREPEQRFQSADELFNALAGALGIEAEPLGARRGRRTWTMGMLAATVAAGALWIGWPGESPPPASPPASPSPTPGTNPNPTPSTKPARLRRDLTAPNPNPNSNPAPATVAIVLEGAPDGASVFVGDTPLRSLPGPLSLPRGAEPMRIRVEAQGYQPREIELIPDEDKTLSAELERVRTGPRSKEPGDRQDGKSDPLGQVEF